MRNPMTLEKPKGCANDDCNVVADGKCVEGYALNECPHVTRISVDEIEEVEDEKTAHEPETFLNLARGEALERGTASVLQCRRLSRTVGIIGPNDAGKTSLVASVYGLLQDGPVSGVRFAGSSTLIGFEMICHNARAASRRTEAHTERTTAGADATFFHLDLQADKGEIVSLFISDRSGEDYLAAADDLVRTNEFFELRRADVVTLLVNGEHLVSSEHRHEAKAMPSQIVDALVEARAFRANCQLAIVLTKDDSVLSSVNSERAHREFNEIADDIAGRYSGCFGTIKRFVIAASPQDLTSVKRGEGVDHLLRYWLLSATAPSVALQRSNSSRLIDLFDAGNEVAE